MRRLIPGVLTIAASAALVLAGWQFATSVVRWQDEVSVPLAIPAPVTKAADMADAGLQLTERRWLPIFGMTRRGLPQKTETGPVTFDYELKGVVATGNMRWAILTKSGEDLLVQEGDRLSDDTEVLAIHAEGLDVQLPDRVLSLGFADSAPVAISRIAEEKPGRSASDERFATMLPPKEATEMIFQDMSQDNILKLLRKAEADRRAKGLLLESR